MAEPRSINAELDALREIEGDMWDAFFAVEVLADRIRMHFERLPSGPCHEIDADGAAVTIWASGKTQDALQKLTERFDLAFQLRRSARQPLTPADPIFTAFARMDALSEAVDVAAERLCPAWVCHP